MQAAAKQMVAGAVGEEAQARAIYESLLALKRSGRLVGDPDNTPKAQPPKTALQLWQAAMDDSADKAAKTGGCYELTVLYVALARGLGLPAIGLEREGSVSTGQIGHVAAGVELSDGRLLVFDLQNESTAGSLGYRRLTLLQLAAYHYNHLAVSLYLHDELVRALAAVDDALALWPDAPAFLSNRATVLAGLGETDLALAEAAHAVELEPKVPVYRYTLGRLWLLAKEPRRAYASLAEALRLWPRYGLALRDLGWAALLLGRPDEADQLLAQARDMRPAVPDAALFFGAYELVRGHKQAAVQLAQEELAHAPNNPGLLALLALAQGEQRSKTGGRVAVELERLRAVIAGAREAVATAAK